MWFKFFKISKSRAEIYPLIGAVTFAVGMGAVYGGKKLMYSPDVKIIKRKPQYPINDNTDFEE